MNQFDAALMGLLSLIQPNRYGGGQPSSGGRGVDPEWERMQQLLQAQDAVQGVSNQAAGQALQAAFSPGPNLLQGALRQQAGEEVGSYDPTLAYRDVYHNLGMPGGLADTLGLITDIIEPGPGEYLAPALGIGINFMKRLPREAAETAAKRPTVYPERLLSEDGVPLSVYRLEGSDGRGPYALDAPDGRAFYTTTDPGYLKTPIELASKGQYHLDPNRARVIEAKAAIDPRNTLFATASDSANHPEVYDRLYEAALRLTPEDRPQTRAQIEELFANRDTLDPFALAGELKRIFGNWDSLMEESGLSAVVQRWDDNTPAMSGWLDTPDRYEVVLSDRAQLQSPNVMTPEEANSYFNFLDTAGEHHNVLDPTPTKFKPRPGMSPEEALMRGLFPDAYMPAPKVTEGGFRQLTADTVDEYVQLLDAMPEGKRGFLTPHSPEKLREMIAQGDRVFVSDDGTGYIVTASGDLQGVVNAGNLKGAGRRAVEDAINNGARTLDAYSWENGKLNLPEYYRNFGFETYEKWDWDDQYAAPNWDYATYGRPKVELMRLLPEHNPDVKRAAESMGLTPQQLIEEAKNQPEDVVISALSGVTGSEDAARKLLQELLFEKP